MNPLEACAPVRHLPAAARVSEVAVSFRLGRPSGSALRLASIQTTHDASDRLLPLYTLATSTYASSAPDSSLAASRLASSSPQGNPVFHDTLDSLRRVQRLCLHRGALSSPAANRCDRASGIPVASPHCPRCFRTRGRTRRRQDRLRCSPVKELLQMRSEMPSLDK